jgi:hypothetical protein
LPEYWALCCAETNRLSGSIVAVRVTGVVGYWVLVSET